MLEQKDIEILKDVITSEITKLEKSVDSKIAKSENAILLEDNNFTLMTELIKDLTKRVEELEKRSA